jgi:Fe-S-cluster containining protein
VDGTELCRALAATTTAAYDCRRCGACCLSPDGGDGYVVLEGDEPERLRRLGLPVVTNGRGEVCLGTVPHDGPGRGRTCVALDGSAGHPKGRGCGCTVYEDRPARCRQFEMGSDLCRQARLRVGLPL